MSERKDDVPRTLMDSLLANDKTPEDLIGEQGLPKQLTTLLVEKALDAEMTEHLGHDRHGAVDNENGNTRNGHRRKTLEGEFGHLPIEVPRDRHGIARSACWKLGADHVLVTDGPMDNIFANGFEPAREWWRGAAHSND